MSETLKHIGESEVNVQHPYLGLSSFHERHKAYFYGRTSEINSLKRLVDRSALTVFFGKSGLGKSSLLRAGLFPVLRRDYHLPIYLRINFGQSDKSNALQQIKTELTNAIQAMDKGAPEIGEMTLWEYFHRTKILNGLVKPVLVFDQFEEVFTLGNHYEVKQLFRELGDLIENRVPVSVQRQYGYEILPFTHKFQNFKVIFSLREDYLAQLESFSSVIPSIQFNRFRLHQLNLKNALEAVYEPAKEIIEKKEAQQIVDLLAKNIGESSEIDINESRQIEIEPFLLSLICDRINDLRFDSDGNMVSEKITSEILDNVDLKEIVAAFYEEVASSSSEELNTFIEKHLLTSDGYRRLQPLVDTQKLFNIPEGEIQELITKRILRKEIWNGREQVELIHDVLVPVVKERRDRRQKIEQDMEVKKVLENQKKEQEEKYDKEKKKQLKWSSTIAAILILFAALFAFILNEKRNEKKNGYLALSQQLTHKSLSMTFWDSRLKGILARHASQFAIENGGKIDEGIYMSLFKSLEFLNGPGFGNDYRLLRNAKKFHNNVRDFKLTKSNLYSLTKEGNILHWDFQKEKPATIALIDTTCYALGADFKNGYLFVGGRFNNLLSFDLDNDNKKVSIPVDDQILVIYNEKVSGKMFAAGGKGIIYTWNMQDDLTGMIASMDSIKLLEEIERIRITTLTSNDSLLAVGTSQHGVYLIDKNKSDTFNILFRNDLPEEYISRITGMKFSKNGKTLIMGNMMGVLMFYDISTQKISLFNYYPAEITDIEIHSNQPLLAASVGDGSVTLWNLDNFEEKLKLEPDLGKCQQSANNISFDFSGKNVLVGYEDGSIIKWPVDLPKLSDDICTALNERMYNSETIDSSWLNKLTEEEWNQHISKDIFHDPKYDCPLLKN